MDIKRSALIGYTGFVGSNLASQYNYTHQYNSKNFQDMKHQQYDLVVCAGISAVKWLANKEPDKDLSAIVELQDVLKTIKSTHFILISTIDVYPISQSANESFDCSSLKTHAYGTHRQEFEKFCNDTFSDCTIVRLPGLFGNGLKKNIIYDLLNDNCLDMINPHSSFQYYYLDHLWTDINIAISNNIKLINLFTEPVASIDILSTFFPNKVIGQNPVAEGHYDLYTQNGKLWNKAGNYIYSKNDVLEQLSEFIKNY